MRRESERFALDHVDPLHRTSVRSAKPADDYAGVAGRLRFGFKRVVCDFGAIASFIALGSLHDSVMLVLVGGLAVFALTTPLNSVRALTIMLLVVYLNPALLVQSGTVLVLRWAVFFAACGRLYYDLLARSVKLYRIAPILYLHVFCGVALACNIATMNGSSVSYLKLFSFAAGSTAVVAGILSNPRIRDSLFCWFIAFAAVLAVGSVPFLFTPLGYFSKERSNLLSETGELVEVDESLIGGFMGILSHAQSFGTLAAMMIVFLAVTVFFSRYTNRWLPGVTMMILAVMLFMSKARTGGVAMIVAVVILFVAAKLRTSNRRRVFTAFKVPVFAVIACCAAMALVGALSEVGPAGGLIRSFISKGSSEDVDLLDAYKGSRGALIERSMETFYRYPLTGVGFGMTEDLRNRPPGASGGGLLSFAYSPSEKGMIVSAVLEETGIVGFLAFVGFAVSMFRLFLRDANVYGVAILSVVLLLNMGEMNLFAVGGLGILQWILIATGAVLVDRCSTPINSVRGGAGAALR